MFPKSRFISLLSLSLLWSAAGWAQLPTTTVEDPAVAGPAFESFDGPRINDVVEQIQRDQAAPTSGVPGLEVGDAVTTYRTLKDAAADGINPLAQKQPSLKITTIAGSEPTASASVWPAFLGGAALMLIGVVLFAFVLTTRIKRPDAQ